MSVNKYQRHIFVLPEDKADRQIANGFHLEIDWERQRRMQVLPEVGGWKKVLDLFQSDHVLEMRATPTRVMILLIDCDGDPSRLEDARQRLPEDLTERVFLLGCLDEPEDLRPTLGSYETIGRNLATDCRDDTDVTWGHDLLKHNAQEVARLRPAIRAILF